VKILFLDQFSEMGGAQRVLVDTIDAALERGWCAHAALPPGGPLAEQLRQRHIEIHEIPCGPYESGTKSVPDMLQFAFDLRRQIQVLRAVTARTHFDLMYVNGPRILAAATFANAGRAPLLFHLHYPIHQRIAASLVRWSLERANATVVACSQTVGGPIRNSIRTDRWHVIENGVRDIPFIKHSFGLNSWIIGIIGRISRQKGQLDFVKAAAMLAAERSSMRFCVCGAALFGEHEYSELVHESAKDLPVEFLGWREDIAAALGRLDLLAMPSQDEGMPRALLEAFSAGVPVVAFPTGGISEVIVDGETGFLTRGNSPEALAARIREALAGGPDLLSTVALNARKSWEQSYSLARYQQRITAVMENLVAASRAERETPAPLKRI